MSIYTFGGLNERGGKMRHGRGLKTNTQRPVGCCGETGFSRLAVTLEITAASCASIIYTAFASRRKCV